MQLLSRALHPFNSSLLVAHSCMPIRHEHTHILWPTCSTWGAGRWHSCDTQGCRSLRLAQFPSQTSSSGKRAAFVPLPRWPPPYPVRHHCLWALCCHRSRNKIHCVLGKETCKRRRGQACRQSWSPQVFVSSNNSGNHRAWILDWKFLPQHKEEEKIGPLHGKSMALNWVLQAKKGRAENRSITFSV